MRRTNAYLNKPQLAKAKRILNNRLYKDADQDVVGVTFQQFLTAVAKERSLPPPPNRYELDLETGEIIEV